MGTVSFDELINTLAWEKHPDSDHHNRPRQEGHLEHLQSAGYTVN